MRDVKVSLDFPFRENGYETFKASVFIPRKMQARFILHYEELLQRRLGKYEYTVSIRPQQLVGRLRVEVNILENSGIVSLEVPPLRNSKQKGNGKAEGKERFYDPWFCYLWGLDHFSRSGLAVLDLFSLDDCACVVSVPKPVRTLKLNEYRADPIHLNRGFYFFAIVFKSFELSLQALYSALEQALPWPPHLLGAVYIK